jgi:hypothetical protein
MHTPVRKIWKGVIPGFKSTNPFYAFIFASIIGATIAWVTVSANNTLDPLIQMELEKHNPNINANATRAAVWAANFGVALSTALVIYLLMYALFGYGEGMTVNSPMLEHQVRRLLRRNGMKWSTNYCPLLHSKKLVIR